LSTSTRTGRTAEQKDAADDVPLQEEEQKVLDVPLLIPLHEEKTAEEKVEEQDANLDGDATASLEAVADVPLYKETATNEEEVEEEVEEVAAEEQGEDEVDGSGVDTASVPLGPASIEEAFRWTEQFACRMFTSGDNASNYLQNFRRFVESKIPIEIFDSFAGMGTGSVTLKQTVRALVACAIQQTASWILSCLGLGSGVQPRVLTVAAYYKHAGS
jgi:hypothetical protein